MKKHIDTAATIAMILGDLLMLFALILYIVQTRRIEDLYGEQCMRCLDTYMTLTVAGCIPAIAGFFIKLFTSKL